MEWQPIETAPGDAPDGDPPRLLVWVANGGRDGKGDVDFGWVYISPRTGNRKPRANGYSSGGWEITHWMPLPSPPPTERSEDE